MRMSDRVRTGGAPCLVFDLGGVLIDVAPADQTITTLAAEAQTPVERLRGPLREAFIRRPYSLAEQFQAGELDEAGFLEALDGLLERPLGAERLRHHLQQMLRGEILGTVALLRQLAVRCRVACLSNTNPVHWRYALEQFAFMQWFSPALASHELAVAKPDARIFRCAERRLGVAAADCLLIDDRRGNVEAARAAGWQAIRFSSAAQLRTDLIALSVGNLDTAETTCHDQARRD